MRKLRIIFLLLYVAVSSFGESAAIFADNSLEVVISEHPLGDGALRLERNDKAPFFTEWNHEDHKEAFQASQVIVKLWREHNIASSYMVYGREDGTSSEKEPFYGSIKESFAWEVVPFPYTENNFFNQSKIWWNVTFGSSELSLEERNKLFNEYVENRYAFLIPYKSTSNPQVIGTDAFCRQDVISKQKIFDGHKVYVLYNYDPLGWGKDKHHFLIVPKAHREKYCEMKEEEYVEASELAQKIIRHYRNKGFPIATLLHRTGKAAGQTVPHWHLHVVLASNRSEELFQLLQIIGRSLFGHHPISGNDLEEKVNAYREELQPVLSFTERKMNLINIEVT